METIQIKNFTITAYSTVDDSWNNANSNSFWGSGYTLTKNGLFITLSENNELFEYIIDNLNWNLI